MHYRSLLYPLIPLFFLCGCTTPTASTADQTSPTANDVTVTDPSVNSYYNVSSTTIPLDINYMFDDQQDFMDQDVASYLCDATGHANMDGTGQMPGSYKLSKAAKGWDAITMYIPLPEGTDVNSYPVGVYQDGYTNIKPGVLQVTETVGNSLNTFNVSFNPKTRVAVFEFAVSPNGNVVQPLDANAHAFWYEIDG